MEANFESAGTLEYPNLFAGDFPTITEKVTVLSGGDLSSGTVVALDGDGKAVPVDSDAGDGGDPRRDPYGVLAFDADASDGDVEGIVYLSGHFNESALSFGGTDDADDHRAALRQLGIFIGNNLGA